MTFEQHARSFGSAAEAYEHGRPGYPAEAVAWAVRGDDVGDRPRRVVDVGAGTGKFTRSLVDLADEVVAVEPDPSMRERLAAVLPDVRALAGTGESLPLPDASADVVTFAQAWHWVDPDAGAAEVARVLRPGGTLALVWNVRDETLPWAARLGEIVTRPESRVLGHEGPVVAAPFGAASSRRFRWVHEQTRSELLDMVASRSYVIVLPVAERREVLRAVEDLLDTAPETAGRGTIAVPYTTFVHRFVRP
jgi:SAM-dependent methyltransferase